MFYLAHLTPYFINGIFQLQMCTMCVPYGQYLLKKSVNYFYIDL